MTSDKNKAAFEAMIQANKGIIYKVVNTYCQSPGDREDLAQEVMLQLWKSFGGYNERYKVSTWMYRIALNVAISFYRKNLARQRVLVPMGDNTAHPASEEPQSQEQQLVLLEQFISELKELDKALMLLYLEQKSQPEIAGILGISTSNVSTKIARIKDKLKKKFLTYNPT